MPPVLRCTLRIILGAAIVWQALAAAIAGAQRLQTDNGAGWWFRLHADTAARVRHVLREDADLVASLRTLVPAGSIVCNRQVQGSLDELIRSARNEDELRATIDRLSAKNGLFIQLTTLLFPDVLFWSVADPVAIVESETQAGRGASLFVLDGDPEPTDRAGWTCAHRTDRFRLWRFQKG